MERLRRLFLRRERPINVAYQALPVDPRDSEQIEPLDDGLCAAVDVTPDALEATPLSFSTFDYIVFVLLGMAMLWSW